MISDNNFILAVCEGQMSGMHHTVCVENNMAIFYTN